MSFTFLKVLEETMPQIVGNRFPNGPRGGFHTIPKFDPFQDHVTALVVNDDNVMRKLWAAKGITWVCTAKNKHSGLPEVVLYNSPCFRRMAVTVEGRRVQKLIGGVDYTADGRYIDNDGRVAEDGK